MARNVKAPDERRNELIQTAKGLFYSKGYEKTSVSDIVKKVGVSQGAFYYYFESKQEILEAVVESLLAQSLALIQSIVANQTLDAIGKWNLFTQAVNNWKIEQKTEMIGIVRILRMDENLRLRHHLRVERARLVGPELDRIIFQGHEEGVFNTDYPLEAARFVFAVMQTATDAFTDILLGKENYENPVETAFRKINASQTAVERILGAPAGLLKFADEETVAAWFVD